MTTHTVLNRDEIVAAILTGGKASDQINRYDVELQKLVESARLVNLGKLAPLDLVQLFDAAFPTLAGTVTAEELTNVITIDPTFTVTTQTDSTVVTGSFNTAMPGLPDDYVRWTISDGTITTGYTADELTYQFANPGVYTIRVDIDYAGKRWSHIETVTVPTGYNPPVVGPSLPPAIVQASVNGYDATVVIEADKRTWFLVNWGNGNATAAQTDQHGKATIVYTYPEDGRYLVTGRDEYESSAVLGEITVPGRYVYVSAGEPVETRPAPLTATAAPQNAPLPPLDIEFDPSDGTVDDVIAYAHEHPDDVAAVLELEQAGKNRKGVTGALTDMLADEGED